MPDLACTSAFFCSSTCLRHTPARAFRRGGFALRRRHGIPWCHATLHARLKGLHFSPRSRVMLPGRFCSRFDAQSSKCSCANCRINSSFCRYGKPFNTASSRMFLVRAGSACRISAFWVIDVFVTHARAPVQTISSLSSPIPSPRTPAIGTFVCSVKR